MDFTGLSDPFTVVRFGRNFRCALAVFVSFGVFVLSPPLDECLDGDCAVGNAMSLTLVAACSEKTKTVMKSLTPKWDETFKVCVVFCGGVFCCVRF